MKSIIGATSFTTYITTALLTGAIDQTEHQNLIKTLKELGPLYNISNFIPNIIEEILLRAPSKNDDDEKHPSPHTKTHIKTRHPKTAYNKK